MSKLGFIGGMAALSLLAGAASAQIYSQPKEERQAQRLLPMSKAAIWTVLRHTKIGEDDKRGVFTATFSPDVKALSGKTIELTGFMLPLDATPKTRHFLLAKYTPVCFFCPPGEPNEVVEVTTTNGVNPTAKMLTVSGKLSLIDNGEKGLFFQIGQASVR